MLPLCKPHENYNSVIDYDRFAEIWLAILQLAFDLKGNQQSRKRKIITLCGLTFKDLMLNLSTLSSIYENCRTAITLGEMIASCIIGVKKE